MPVLELTDEQVISLIKALPKDQQQRIAANLTKDFDAPLEDFKQYIE